MTVTSSLQTTDGAKIFYEIYGERRSPARVLLIHSLAMDHSFWRPVAERLVDAGVCAVALDCRGHGASSKPAGTYVLERLAADARELLDRLEWPDAVVAGCSIGGIIGMGLALDHPGRVSGLSLIDTTAWFGPDAMRDYRLRADAVIDKGLAPYVDMQVVRWFSDAFSEDHPAVVQSCVEIFLANDVQAYAAACRMLGEVDLRHALGRLEMPVGIVVGEDDLATPPAMAEALKAAIPHASFRSLAHARHLTPLERPDDIAAEILAVVDRAGGNRANRNG